MAVQTVDDTGDAAVAAQATEPSLAVVELLPDLDEPASAFDQLPSFLATGPQVLQDSVPQTARFLGNDDSGVRYWTALNTGGDVCLIALMPGTGQAAGMSCATPRDILDRGLGLQVSDADVAVRAFIVPDDYVPAAPGFTKIDRNLIVELAENDMSPTVLEPRSSEALSSDPIRLTQFDATSEFED